MTWTDPRGNGKLWIVQSQSPETVDYLMRFGNFPEMESSIRLSPTGADVDNPVTTVRWNSRGRLPGGPFYGVWAHQFSNHMQQRYQQWLVKLKAKMEAIKLPPDTEELEPKSAEMSPS
jgi:exonuclease V gamma subunit